MIIVLIYYAFCDLNNDINHLIRSLCDCPGCMSDEIALETVKFPKATLNKKSSLTGSQTPPLTFSYKYLIICILRIEVQHSIQCNTDLKLSKDV